MVNNIQKIKKVKKLIAKILQKDFESIKKKLPNFYNFDIYTDDDMDVKYSLILKFSINDGIKEYAYIEKELSDEDYMLSYTERQESRYVSIQIWNNSFTSNINELKKALKINQKTLEQIHSFIKLLNTFGNIENKYGVDYLKMQLI